MRAQQRNTDYNEVWTIDAVLPYQNSWLTAYAVTGGVWTTSRDAHSGIERLRQPLRYLYTGLTFRLPYDWIVETSVRCTTRALYNILFVDPRFGQDLTMRKSFLLGKLQIALPGYGVWGTERTNTCITMRSRDIRLGEIFTQMLRR